MRDCAYAHVGIVCHHTFVRKNPIILGYTLDSDSRTQLALHRSFKCSYPQILSSGRRVVERVADQVVQPRQPPNHRAERKLHNTHTLTPVQSTSDEIA